MIFYFISINLYDTLPQFQVKSLSLIMYRVLGKLECSKCRAKHDIPSSILTIHTSRKDKPTLSVSCPMTSTYASRQMHAYV